MDSRYRSRRCLEAFTQCTAGPGVEGVWKHLHNAQQVKITYILLHIFFLPPTRK